MISAKQLEAFDPFSDLDEKTKLIASKLITIDTVSQSTVLFDIGDNDDFEYFLVSGEIDLIAIDGLKKRIRSGDPIARFPLALLRPRKFSAEITSESAKIIKLEVNVLKTLKSSTPVVGDAFSAYSRGLEPLLSTSEVSLDDVKQFLISASKAIVENKIVIGNFDSVSNTIFNVINDPEISLDTLTSAIQLDPAISAKITQAANSAFFGGLEKVDAVRAAVVRLGLDLSVQLVTVMVMKEVFSSKNESLQLAMDNVWRTSLKLATFSVVVGKKSNCAYQQGQTLLAGLMVEMGSLVVITYLNHYPSHLQHLSDEILSSNRIKRKLAKDLLIQWRFPQAIIEVIEQSEDYHRDVPQADLVDIVAVSKLLIRMTNYRKLPVDDITELSSFTRLGFNADNPTQVEDIIEEAQRYADLFSGVAN